MPDDGRRASRHRAEPAGWPAGCARRVPSAWRIASRSRSSCARRRKASRGVAPAGRPLPRHGLHGHPRGAGPRRVDTAAKTVYDARDIYVDAGNLARLPRPARALVGRLERGWARRADRVITVNRPYAEVMAARWGVELPLIVLNCSYRYDPPEPRPRRFHEALGLRCRDARRALPGRLLARSRDRAADRGDPVGRVGGAGAARATASLQAELERRAADPSLDGRVRILPAVPPDELLAWVASADVVAMPIQPTTLNHRLTTPNKLFEAMAAGVPGRRERPARHGRHRPRDRRRRARRPDRPGRHRRRDHADPRRAARRARGLRPTRRWRPRTRRTTGNARWTCCSPSTARLTGRPW